MKQDQAWSNTPVVRPAVIKAPRPGYTDDAWRRKVQGHVMVSARIGADGTVAAVRVRKSLIEPALTSKP